MYFWWIDQIQLKGSRRKDNFYLTITEGSSYARSSVRQQFAIFIKGIVSYYNNNENITSNNYVQSIDTDIIFDSIFFQWKLHNSKNRAIIS